jgi:hypothetical protein
VPAARGEIREELEEGSPIDTRVSGYDTRLVEPERDETGGGGHLVPARRPRLFGPGLRWLAIAAGLTGLFLGYLCMSRAQPTNSDGASNALQAWDILHGNLLLHGWTLSDVSFYTTELPQYALIEAVYGLHSDVIHVAAAMTYTLLVFAAAMLARGRARGVAGLARAGLAVAIMLVPQPGLGYLTLLNSPDHTGTGLPVLVTWIVLERGLTRPDGSNRVAPARWLPYALAVLLGWVAVGDSLVLATAVLPLLAVAALRRLRAPYGRLFVAGLASVVLMQAILLVVRLAGGFSVHAVPMRLAGLDRLGHNARIAIVGLAVDFGAYLPLLSGTGAHAVAALRIVGMIGVAVAVTLVAVRAVRAFLARPPRRVGDAVPESRHRDDPVSQLLAFGIIANLAAFVASTLPFDRLSARQVVSVLPLGAALAGRVYGPRITAGLRAARRHLPVLVAALLGLSTAFGVQAAQAHPAPAANQNIAQWLQAQHLTYGLGGYWNANVITLATSGLVRVVPLSAGAERRGVLFAYRWESRADWFDPARHDARFVVVDLDDPGYGTLKVALGQFGRPINRQDFGRYTVLVYDHNLLVGLPALCGGGHSAPSMAECP